MDLWSNTTSTQLLVSSPFAFGVHCVPLKEVQCQGSTRHTGTKCVCVCLCVFQVLMHVPLN